MKRLINDGLKDLINEALHSIVPQPLSLNEQKKTFLSARNMCEPNKKAEEKSIAKFGKTSNHYIFIYIYMIYTHFLLFAWVSAKNTGTQRGEHRSSEQKIWVSKEGNGNINTLFPIKSH